MAQVAQEVVESFRREAEQRHIELKTEIGNSAYYLHADVVKISIALSNLVKNAIQFTESGGHVIVKVEDDSGYIKVTVLDDGIGIPPRELPRVFERFYQVESHLTRRYGGMGLGLSVAKAVIELHGGRIWAESSGRGSTFTFLLPVNHGGQFASQPAAFIS
jgi:signal transduction histidine kinase